MQVTFRSELGASSKHNPREAALCRCQVVEMKKAAMAAAAEFTWSNAALQYEATNSGVIDALLPWRGTHTHTDGDTITLLTGHLPGVGRQGRAATVRRTCHSHAGDRQTGLLDDSWLQAPRCVSRSMAASACCITMLPFLLSQASGQKHSKVAAERFFLYPTGPRWIPKSFHRAPPGCLPMEPRWNPG